MQLDLQTASGEDSARAWNDPADLARCDREPVHTSGAIMPHGVLLVLAPGEHRIVGVSANAEFWFKDSPEALLNKPLDAVFPEEPKQKLESGMANIDKADPPRYLGSFWTLKSEREFDVFVHRSGDVLLLEFDSLPSAIQSVPATERFAQINAAIAAMRVARTWREGMTIAVEELKRLTGMDSVIGARMLPDGTGHAVAEAREASFQSFLDKRFPYSGIPDPARRAMLLMPVQYAPAHAYRPVPILMAEGQPEAARIDLSYSVLRSMSRMCSQYYLNMGAGARLLLVLIENNQLWGFFSCLSAAPRQVPYSDRLAYHLFAEMASQLLVEKQKAEYTRQCLDVKRSTGEIISGISSAEAFSRIVNEVPGKLFAALNARGAVLRLNNRYIRSGDTPDEGQLNALTAWLDGQEALVATDRLPNLFPPAAGYPELATGLIAARLMKSGQYLMVFRPEQVYEVKWTGDPRKPVEVDTGSGERRLTPRGSFEAWKEVVKGTSSPWQDYETDAMKELQRSIVPLQLFDQQQRLASNLRQSNSDLEMFAYAVSHDLKEPLRGILKISHLLKQDIIQEPGHPAQNYLDRIAILGSAMAGQIDAILHYSQANQQSIEREPVDLNVLLNSVLEHLAAQISETGAEIKLPARLPAVSCDPARASAIFQNLITNAIKYNDKVEKQVEVGYLAEPVTVFYVRDNGIGIHPQHRETIFTLFRRLHKSNEYGGGAGVGLNLTRKHVEKHGGKLWVESETGRGSTFFFTLEPGLEDNLPS